MVYLPACTVPVDRPATPLVLLCPAWKRWGTATTVKPGTVILHSRADETVPFADSEELVRNSGLPPKALIVVGTDHRLADPEPLKAMLEAVEWAAPGEKAGATPDQEAVLEFLRNSQPTPAAKALLKRTMQQFVWDYGWWYEPGELPKHVPLGATTGRFAALVAILMRSAKGLQQDRGRQRDRSTVSFCTCKHKDRAFPPKEGCRGHCESP
jgi:hypothetical protein